jgi:hypothetical protein
MSARPHFRPALFFPVIRGRFRDSARLPCPSRSLRAQRPTVAGEHVRARARVAAVRHESEPASPARGLRVRGRPRCRHGSVCLHFGSAGARRLSAAQELCGGRQERARTPPGRRRLGSVFQGTLRARRLLAAVLTEAFFNRNAVRSRTSAGSAPGMHTSGRRPWQMS